MNKKNSPLIKKIFFNNLFSNQDNKLRSDDELHQFYFGDLYYLKKDPNISISQLTK